MDAGDTADEFLYHYTDQHGLLGILGEKGPRIRASNAYYLNDSREIVLSIELAELMLREHSEWDANTPRAHALNAMCEQLTPVGTAYPIYVASFSSDSDSLSQWRGYTGGGPGYAIGFPRSLLEKAVRENWGFVERCSYDEQEQRDRIAAYIEQRLSDFSERLEIGGTDLDHLIYSAGWTFVVNFPRVAASVKDPSFAEEHEWRAISSWRFRELDVNEYHFRPGKLGLTPYIYLPIPSRISDLHIVVGPTAHGGLATRAVTDFLSQWGFTNATVSPSKIPYRNW